MISPPSIHHFFVCLDHRLPPSCVEAVQSKRTHVTHPRSTQVFGTRSSSRVAGHLHNRKALILRVRSNRNQQQKCSVA